MMKMKVVQQKGANNREDNGLEADYDLHNTWSRTDYDYTLACDD
jgi:hypothetical protein